jgi:hypothetical protein
MPHMDQEQAFFAATADVEGGRDVSIKWQQKKYDFLFLISIEKEFQISCHLE